jgi:hypothetical protein
MMAGERSYAKLGATRTSLQQAANDRLLDAEALLQAGRFASAIAEGLYALEITLKVLICKRLDLQHLPKAFEVHDFAGLLVLSGFSRQMQGEVKLNWDEITREADWHINALRYTSPSNLDQSFTTDFLARLRTPPHGVIPWLETLL